MTTLTVRLTALAMIGVVLTGCASPRSDPILLSGVTAINPLSSAGQLDGDIAIVDDRTIDVWYLVGSCGGEGNAPEHALAVQAEFSTEAVVVVLDGGPRCGAWATTTDVGYLRGSRVGLDEAIGGREVRLEERTLLP